MSPLQQFTVKFALPSSFRPLKGQPSDELDSSTEELLFELELFCETSPDFTDEEDFSSSVRVALEEEPIESTEPLLWIASSPLLLEFRSFDSLYRLRL